MANPKDMFGSSKNRGNKNTPFNSNKQSTFDLFNINVDKATKATDSIFNYARKQATSYNKFYISTTSRTMKSTADIMVSSYNKIYKQLDIMHNNYLQRVVDSELSTINMLSEKWKELNNSKKYNQNKSIILSQPTPVYSTAKSTKDSTIGTTKITNIKNESKDNYTYITNNNTDDKDSISEFMKNFSQNLDNKVNNFSSHMNNIEKSVLNIENNSENDSNSDNNSFNINNNSNSNLIAKSITDSLDKFINIWVSRFESGIDRIYQVYENTYTRVSAIMNQDQDQYMSWQSSTLSKMNEMGLGDNLAISTVMETLSDVTNKGITGQKAQNKALSDSISKTIAPFLDTTTNAYTDLQFKLGDQFVSSINGMGEELSRQTGSQRVFSSGINEIISMLNPIMLNAKADYADKYLGEMMAGLEQAVADGKMTYDQALQLAYDVSQASTDWYSTVNSDNLLLRSAVINAEDPTNPASLLREISRTGSTGDYIFAGVNGVREMSTVLNVIGASKYISQNADWYAISDAIEEGMNNWNANSEKTGNSLLKEFAEGNRNTATAMKNISAENASLGVSQFRQRYPDAYSILNSILTTLITIATTNIFDKFGDGFLNKATGKLGNFFKGKITNIGGKAGNWLSSLFKSGSTSGVSGLSLFQKLGNGLINTKNGIITSGATTSGGIMTATGALAGITMAIYGTTEAIKDFKKATSKTSTNDEKKDATITGTLNTVGALGGGIGAGALIAGGASAGPLGWIALAIGGIGLGAAALYKAYNKQSKAVEQITKKYEEQKEIMKQEQAVRASQISTLKEEIAQTETTEDKRQLIIDQGLVSEEEANKMTNAQIDTFVSDLQKTDEKLSNKETEIYEELERIALQKQEDIQKENEKLVYNQIVSEKDVNKQKEMLKALGFSEDEISTIGTTYEAGSGQTKRTEKVTVSSLLNSRGTWGAEGSKLENTTAETFNDFANIYKTSGYKQMSDDKDAESTAKLFSEISEAKAFLDMYKDKKNELTEPYQKKYDKYKEFLSEQEDIKTGQKYDVSMYAAGNPYLASNQLAYLHQGEAVLTKEQNKQYRTIATTIPTLNKTLDNLFNKTSNYDSKETDADRNDVIKTINDSINKIIEAIMSLKEYSNKTMKGDNINNMNRILNNKYSDNMISLSPSMNIIK